uniref:Uncharacterized protein n=1 Tax=uncultured Nitrospirota bacterium TaxID=170969 RepID=A0A142BTU2_9BACT|nr:hypothetical protein [uncultured Nitrospirota bacterium]
MIKIMNLNLFSHDIMVVIEEVGEWNYTILSIPIFVRL